MRTYFLQAIICIALLSSGASVVRGAAKPVDLRAPRNSDGKVFVHPGISYTQGDLDRMKAMVDAGVQPSNRRSPRFITKPRRFPASTIPNMFIPENSRFPLSLNSSVGLFSDAAFAA